jgi:DNA excision repair protein ERCC-4
VVNHAAIDMMRAIPGITARNYYLITRRIPTIQALVACPEEKLAKIVGRETARQIVKFFDSKLD